MSLNPRAAKFFDQLEEARLKLSGRCGRDIKYGDPHCVWQMHPQTHKDLLKAFEHEELKLAFEEQLLGSNVMAWGVEEITKMIPGTIRLAMTSNLE